MNTSNSGARLKVALHSLGRSPSRFASDFGISNQALNNWFVRGVPGKSLLAVAKYLQVRPEWLDSGEGEIFVSQIDEDYRNLSESDRAEADRQYRQSWLRDTSELTAQERNERELEQIRWMQQPNSRASPTYSPTHVFDFPEISWQEAAAGVEALNFSELKANPQYKSEVFAGHNGFWLRVVGGSMTSSTQASFPEGYLILVSPDTQPRTGQLIVARLIGSNEATFKQLAWDAGDFYLKPLNPAYPIKLMDENWEIVGTVVDGKIPKTVFQ